MGTLTVQSLEITSTEVVTSPPSQTFTEKSIKGIIIPHHLLVQKQMDEFYKLTAKNRPNINRIILVAPNHFLYGYHYIQSTDQEFTPKNSPKLDQEFIKNLTKKTPLATEPKYFEKEHGIMAELSFISKYFPEAKIVPITLKNNIPQDRLDPLINELNKADLSNTLILASIDFTHYETESISVENDNRTIAWLKEWGKKSPKDVFNSIKKLAKSPAAVIRSAVAMDSSESLYLIVKVMENLQAKNVSLWKRTSSSSLLNIQDPLQNTSHLFITFSEL